MSSFEYTMVPGAGAVFAQNAFAQKVGGAITVRDLGGIPHQGTVLAVVVAPDGLSAQLRVDVPGFDLGDAGPFSFASEVE